MKLKKLTSDGGPGGCLGGNCPAVYETDRDSLVIQGYKVTDSVDISLPENETVVEVPSALIKQLVESGKLS